MTKDRGLRVAATTFALACATLHLGCRKTSDDFCCLTPASCASGGASTLMSCDDPDKAFCDDTGTYGPARTCIADPGASPCTGPDECTNPDRPFCIDETCAQCETSDDCVAGVPLCGASHLCGPCEVEEDCAGRDGAEQCDADTGACVACLDSPHCPSTVPVCVDFECRGCTGDDQCDSEVCFLDSGACAPVDDVIYVEAGGATTGSCTSDSACSTIARALQQVMGTRNIIKVRPGTYPVPVVIDGQTVTIVGDDAILRPGGLDLDVVHVRNGADVTLERLTISGANPDTADPVGLRCSDATTTVRLTRSTVSLNTGGAIDLRQCQFSLTNNFIVGNGAPFNTKAAVAFREQTVGTLHEFAFNTVAANTANANIIGGLECVSLAVAMELSSNIVYDNDVSGSGTQVGGDVDCTWSHSDIGPQTPVQPGSNNLSVDPMFVAPADRDFHLNPSSPVRGQAEPDLPFDLDFDGDARPLGSGPDMGADEVVE